MYNNSMSLFPSSLMMGTILTIYSNSWLGIWMGLEINFLSITPMLSDNKSSMINEPAIKYFLIISMASTILLMSILIIQMKFMMSWEKMSFHQ